MVEAEANGGTQARKMTKPSPLYALLEPPWLRVARGELGVCEVPGKADNPRILEYQRTTRAPGTPTHDADAWCSDFANWCMQQCGLRGTGRANARSWLAWGQPIQIPRLGCIAVFAAPSRGAWAGHVAFWLSSSADHRLQHVLGGNQRDAVCEADRLTRDLLGYRWPMIVPVRDEDESERGAA